jgi:osmotically-inducible protein OsmY
MTQPTRLGAAGAVLAIVLGFTFATAADPTNPMNPVDRATDAVDDAVRGAKPTASDQSNDPTDVRITREIRQAIVDDDSLSTNAHNVKVITVDGVVTLRGPVDDAAEQARVVSAARGVEGVKRIENQLEVTPR